MLLGRDQCDRPIPRPEEAYHVCVCVCVCVEWMVGGGMRVCVCVIECDQVRQ